MYYLKNLVIFFTLFFVLIGCDPVHYRLKGTVVNNINEIQKPVANAKVRMKCSLLRDKKGLTDKDGVFLFKGIGVIDHCDCIVYIEHPDYKNKIIQISPEHLIDGTNPFYPIFGTIIVLDKNDIIKNKASESVKDN